MSFLSRLLNPTPDGTSMSAADFVAQGDPEAPVLDVRTPGEFASGHLAGAVNVDVMSPTFQSQVAALDLPTDGPVYLYCRSGNRSAAAAERMREAGLTVVDGGSLEDMAAAGYPMD